MNDTNSFVVTGRLTRDIEIVEFQNGNKVAKGTIATNRSYKKDDEWKEETAFLDFKLFGNKAQSISDRVAKGDAVLLEGRIDQENWEQDGQKRSKLVINVENYKPMGQVKQDGQQKSAPPPASKGKQTKSSYSSKSQDDDVPF